MFWLVAYFVCYGVYIILQAILKKRWSDVKRTLLFTLATWLTLAVVFLPMIIVVLRANYSVSYSVYNVNGFPGELRSQAQYLGIGLLVMIFAGTVYGVVKRKTRVPNDTRRDRRNLYDIYLHANSEHGLSSHVDLVPAYFLLMLICFGGICSLEKNGCLRSLLLWFWDFAA